MNICFNVLHQRLIRGDSVPLIEGSKDYIHCTFTFSEDWTTLGKAALFSLQGDSKTYVAVIDNNACKIPDAVCQSGGRCEMALIGAGYDVIDALSSGSTDELKSADVIITTNRCELRFGETVTVNTVNEDESEENPFADVLAKITALSDSYESKQNKTDDALTTEDKTVVGAINETHSKAWDAMSAAETALNNTSVNEMLMGSLDNLTTQEKSTIVGAINETAEKQERLQYYGDANIVPTDMTKFKFTISDGTASIDGFADGVTLTDIVIPYKYVDDNGNEYRVTTISDSAFFHIPSLTSVIIPSAITEIRQQAFESCGLTSVYIPDSVITIGKYAFQSSTIKKVRLSNSLAEISEGVFATCPIEEIVIPDSVTSIGGAAFVFAKDTHITIPHNVTSLGDYVFEGCTSLLEVEILNDNITISNDAFVDCTNVTIICGEGSTAEAFCKAHSIPYRYNTVTDDFIITGILENVDNHYNITVSDVSCTYEEARAAFDAGRNVKCVLASSGTGIYVTMNFMGYNEDALLFECLYDKIHCILAFTSNGIDTGLSQGYASIIYVNDAWVELRDMITESQPYKMFVEFTNTYSTWDISRASESFAFLYEALRHERALILDALCFDEDGGTIRFNDYTLSGDESSIIFERVADNGKFRVTVDADDNWSGEYIQFATEETVSNLETQIGDINTALETALNGGAS